MERYFFHTKDGEQICDPEGTELPDLAAAKAEAIQYLANVLDHNPGLLLKTGSFSITMTDGDGLVLFTLDLTGVSSGG